MKNEEFFKIIEANLPNVRVNGTQLHLDSKITNNMIFGKFFHALWSEGNGLAIDSEDVLRIDNHNGYIDIRLKNSQQER